MSRRLSLTFSTQMEKSSPLDLKRQRKFLASAHRVTRNLGVKVGVTLGSKYFWGSVNAHQAKPRTQAARSLQIALQAHWTPAVEASPHPPSPFQQPTCPGCLGPTSPNLGHPRIGDQVLKSPQQQPPPQRHRQRPSKKDNVDTTTMSTVPGRIRTPCVLAINAVQTGAHVPPHSFIKRRAAI